MTHDNALSADPSAELSTHWAMAGASDRVSAIVAAAFLEDALLRAIQACAESDEKSFEALFQPIGPLGSYAARVHLGRVLNIYSKETRDELLRVGKVRNRFAHSAEPVTFDREDIRDLCLSIEFADRFRRVYHPPIAPVLREGVEYSEARRTYLMFVQNMVWMLERRVKGTPSWRPIP